MTSERAQVRGLACGVVVAAALLVSNVAAAQDSHYWTLQYGNNARILGGAVVGGVNDLSAVYYNPGRLAMMGRSELLLAGNVIEMTKTELTAPNRERVELADTRVKLSPSLLAGELHFGFLGSSRLAYSFLTRQSSEFDSMTRGNVTIPSNVFGISAITEDIQARHRLAESWGGLTWATRIGENVGFGVSAFVGSRSHRGALQGIAQTVVSSEDALVNIYARDYDYTTWHLTWKLGASTTIASWDVGAAVKLPNLQISGGGQVGFDNTLIGVDPETGDAVPTAIEVNFQGGLAAEYRSPLSVALGATRTFGASRVHLSGEYFAPVDLFTVLDAEPVTGQTTGAVVEPDFKHEMDSVLNVGVGVEHRFRGDLKGFASFRTDFSGATDNAAATLSFTRWDLYHFAGGASFRVGEAEFTLGAIIATGGAEALTQLPADVESRFLRATVIIGFSFPFGDPVTL